MISVGSTALLRSMQLPKNDMRRDSVCCRAQVREHDAGGGLPHCAVHLAGELLRLRLVPPALLRCVHLTVYPSAVPMPGTSFKLSPRAVVYRPRRRKTPRVGIVLTVTVSKPVHTVTIPVGIDLNIHMLANPLEPGCGMWSTDPQRAAVTRATVRGDAGREGVQGRLHPRPVRRAALQRDGQASAAGRRACRVGAEQGQLRCAPRQSPQSWHQMLSCQPAFDGRG